MNVSRGTFSHNRSARYPLYIRPRGRVSSRGREATQPNARLESAWWGTIRHRSLVSCACAWVRFILLFGGSETLESQWGHTEHRTAPDLKTAPQWHTTNSTDQHGTHDDGGGGKKTNPSCRVSRHTRLRTTHGYSPTVAHARTQREKHNTRIAASHDHAARACASGRLCRGQNGLAGRSVGSPCTPRGQHVARELREDLPMCHLSENYAR